MSNNISQLMAFVRKEFYHIFRDRRTLLILFGLPIAQILLFGFALTNEVKNARLLIVDPSNGPASRLLISKIQTGPWFDIQGVDLNKEHMEDYFKSGQIRCALIFPPNFDASLKHERQTAIQVVTDATDPNFAKVVVSYVTSMVALYLKDANQVQVMPGQIMANVRMLYNPSLNGSMSFVPGVIALVMMIVCCTLTAVSLVREKESGTIEVLLVSPLKPLLILIAKTIPFLVLSLMDLGIILLLSQFLLGVPVQGNLMLLFMECTLYIVTCLSLGLLISLLTDSQAAAMLISMAGMLLPTLLFTGFIFPLENMPLIFQWISNIVPAKWFYIIMKNVMLKGLGFSSVWMETLILAGMATLFLNVSMRKFKVRLQ